jgi:hypothetical protein
MHENSFGACQKGKMIERKTVWRLPYSANQDKEDEQDVLHFNMW